MSHLRRRGAMQFGYAGIRHSHLTISSNTAVEDPDTQTSELFRSLPQSLPADRQEDVEVADSISEPDESPYIYTWIQPVVEYDLTSLEVFFPLEEASPAPSLISVAAPGWLPSAPASAPPIERARPVFIRATDTYLFPEAPLSLSTFDEQIDEVASIAPSDIAASSASVSQDAPVTRGVLASLRALAFFNKPEVNASSPTSMKRPLFRIWRHQSSNRLSQPRSNGNIEGSEDEGTTSPSPIQRPRTLFNMLPPSMGLRRKEVTQTV